MERGWPGLTDRQWDEIRWILPPRVRKPFLRRRRSGGRPRASDRKVFEAILWTLRAPGPFERLPERFGRRRTVLRRLPQWLVSGRLHKLWEYYLRAAGPEERRVWAGAMTRAGAKSLWAGMLWEYAKSHFPGEFSR